MLRLTILTLSMLLISATEPAGEVLQAVRSSTAIWLPREGGELSRLDDGAAAPTRVRSPLRALALCSAGDAPLVVGSGKAGWQVLRRDGDGWRAGVPTPALKDESFVGGACWRGGVTILTDKRIIGQKGRSLTLHGYKPSMSVRTVVYRYGGFLLVGSNAGEWGGSLLRIPISTGRVEVVPGIGEPIHDIAADPHRPGCVVAAAGLVHMLPTGRLIRLCGGSARTLYARAWTTPGLPRTPPQPGEDPYESVAFFGLATGADGDLRAIGLDGIYRITRSDAVTGPAPLPAFVARGGVRAGRVAPNLDLVVSGVSGRVSLGGAMPIVVRR